MYGQTRPRRSSRARVGRTLECVHCAFTVAILSLTHDIGGSTKATLIAYFHTSVVLHDLTRWKCQPASTVQALLHCYAAVSALFRAQQSAASSAVSK